MYKEGRRLLDIGEDKETTDVALEVKKEGVGIIS